MEQFEIHYFRKNDGSCPVKSFIDSLDPKMMSKMFMELKLLKDNGPRLREPYSKPLGDGIFELRVQQSTNITRVLYFFYDGKRIVLTNGFVKKTPKTPAAELAAAKKYRADFLSRKEKSDG